MTRTGYQAYLEGMRKMNSGFTFPAGTCLKQQRTLLDVGAYDFTPTNGRDPWAIEAFDFAKFKHPTSSTKNIPKYVPIYWRKHGRPGHIALYVGDGNCLTTDKPTSGRFGIVPVTELSRAWGMEFVGWAEDLNRVRIWTPPPAKPKPPAKQPKLTVASRFTAIDKLAIGIIHDTTSGTPNNHAAWQVHHIARERAS